MILVHDGILDHTYVENLSNARSFFRIPTWYYHEVIRPDWETVMGGVPLLSADDRWQNTIARYYIPRDRVFPDDVEVDPQGQLGYCGTTSQG